MQNAVARVKDRMGAGGGYGGPRPAYMSWAQGSGIRR